jgi:hypothetical protein
MMRIMLAGHQRIQLAFLPSPDDVKRLVWKEGQTRAEQ